MSRYGQASSMLGVGKGVFVQIPGELDERLLHPAKVVASGDGLYTAELEEPDVPIEAGMDVIVLYEARGEFTQQQARIDVVMDDGPAPLIGFQTVGQPASAESRRFSRVSTMTTGLSAQVGQEECPVIDVSAAGLAVTGAGAWGLGDRVPVSLRFESSTYAGSTMVQSVRALRDGRMRYGLLCLNERGSTLKAGLEGLSAAIQRQQIRRLMGTG